MRRIMLAVSLVAMMMFTTVPALADDGDNRFDFDGDFDHDVEQEADSGDVDQSFEVTGGGDNSNQTVSTQGVANTGNAQNIIGVSDGFDDGFDDKFFEDGFDDGFFNDGFFNDGFFFGDFDGDGFDDGFEFEDVGASIELSPEQVVTSDQGVDQAATSFG